MTLTILCAGALAPPGTQRTGLQASSDSAAPRGLAVAQLRERLREERSTHDSGVALAPALRTRLRRARIARRHWLDAAAPDELPDEQWLRTQFALDGTVAACVLGPAALVVRPVHLHLGMDQLVLASPTRVYPDADEARQLIDSANHWLTEDGLALVADHAADHVADHAGDQVRERAVGHPAAWRLEARSVGARQRLDALAALCAPSARLASGRSIAAWLPRGAAQRDWRSIDNLVQMAWFEHPVNERRAAQGLLPLNALWLDGRAGAARLRPFAQVATNDAALSGLARRAGAQVTDPDRYAGGADGGADMLLDAGFWREAMADGDSEAWHEAWKAFGQWFARAISGNSALRLVLTGERAWIELACEPGDRWRFWRRLDLQSLFETGTNSAQ